MRSMKSYGENLAIAIDFDSILAIVSEPIKSRSGGYTGRNTVVIYTDKFIHRVEMRSVEANKLMLDWTYRN